MNGGWDVVPGPGDQGEAEFLRELLHEPDAPDLDAELRREIYAAADSVMVSVCPRHLRELVRPSGRLRSWLRWRFGSWERFLWWLADIDHWAGWVNDPAEVETPTAWLSLHWVQLSCWRNGRTDVRDRARLLLLRLPFRFRLAVAAMWR